MIHPICRTCGSNDSTCVGRLPDCHEFAGVTTDGIIPGGALWRCEACRFLFRHPLLSATTYNMLYRNGSSEIWEGTNEPATFRLVKDALASIRGAASVLDIGCYTGALLESLPSNFERYGVEMNQAAARIAEARGVRLVAETFEQLGSSNDSYDVIVACDVIEHVPNPLVFLHTLRARLKVGGKIMLTTGNTEAWLWRALGSRFWYCYFPEHISFIGDRWISNATPMAGLSVEKLVRFNYLEGQPQFALKVARSFVGAFVYYCSQVSSPIYKILRRVGGRDPRVIGPSGCGSSQDHLFCVLSAI